MKTLWLIRLTRNAYATYGQFEDAERAHLCYTVERPWLDNQHDVSCIPPGVYECHLRDSKRGYPVYGVYGVPDRDNIEIHIANLPSELEGCIAVGESFGTATIKSGETGHGVLGSTVAFGAFMATMAGQPFELTVIDPPIDPPSENAQ